MVPTLRALSLRFGLLLSSLLACGAPASGIGPRTPDADGEGLVEALREAAVPLGEADDLGAVIEWVADARCVLLGEATHGTSEFYALRAHISRALIEQRGFRFVAVEGDWAACMRVHRYIQGDDGWGTSARAVLNTFDRWPRWMWANEEMVELVEWLRAHNADLPADERVGFFGLDVYGVRDSVRKVPQHLLALDPELAQLALERLACFDVFAEQPGAYVSGLRAGRASCEVPLEELLAMLRQRRSAHRELDAEAQFHAKQNALVVQNAEHHYRAMLRQDAESWNARARHFHVTLERLLEHHGPDSRGVVWAHNTHVGDARATSMAAREQVNIGQLARQSLGPAAVRVIGFATHRGQVLAGASWGAEPRTLTIPAAQPGSLEDLLERTGLERALLFTERIAEHPGFQRLLPHRAIGVVYDPAQEHLGNYVPSVVPRRYDALIFLSRTSPLRPLHERDGDSR